MDAQSERWKRSKTIYERIHALSLVLLSDPDDFIRPSAANLVRYAAIGGTPFRATQTLKNRYRNMISIWTDAHEKLVALKVPILFSKSKNKFDIDPRVQSLEDIIRVLYKENLDLRAQLGSQEPIVSPDATPVHYHTSTNEGNESILDMRPLREWVKRIGLQGSYLEVAKVGLKLTQNARIGVTVMTDEVYQVLKAL